MIVLGPQELNHFPLHLNSKARTQPHNRHYVHLNIQLLYYNLLWTRGKGVAVYAYFILANRIDSTTTLTNLSLTLDNEFVGTFKHIPANTTDIEYNSPIHVNETLENKQHTLVIPTRGPSEAQDSNLKSSLLLFDYVEYTYVTIVKELYLLTQTLLEWMMIW